MLMLLSSFALVALFALIVHCADWDNPDGLTADQLISGGDEGTYKPIDPSLAATPQKSREAWSTRTGVNFTMPKTLSDSGNSAKESRDAAEAATTAQDQSASTQETSSTQTPEAAQTTQAPEVTQTTPSPETVSGSWSFELNDNTLKNMVLTLFQTGDAVFGTGSMNDGNSTLIVAASGSFDGSKLNLDLTTLGSISLYKLALAPSGDSASGDFQAFSASGDTWMGSARGTRSSQ
ncbi:MAG: hypothetical protein ACE14P_07435 [Methanotrichaceae archaeon]